MLKNIGSYWAFSVAQVLMFLVLTPFTVNVIGKQGYGIWTYVLSTTAPLQLLVLGVPVATVRTVSRCLATKDYPGANRALGESISLAIVLGALAIVLGLALYAAFPTLSADWGLRPEQAQDAGFALLLVSIQLALAFSLRLPYAVFNAHQDFVARNVIMGLGLLLRLGLTLILLSRRADLSTLAAVQLVVLFAEFALARAVSSRRHVPIRFTPCALNWAAAKSILSFSLFAFLLNMGTLLAFRLDAVVIGQYREPEDITVYGIGNKLFDPLYNLLMAIAMVVMPMATDLHTRGIQGALRDLFLKWSKIAVALILMVGGYLMVLGPAFLRWWIPASAYEELSSTLMQLLLVSLFLFLPVRAVALPILLGIGKPKGAALGLLAMGLANLGLSLALVQPYGLIGVALGTAIPNMLFSLWLAKNACSHLEVSFTDWARYSVLKAGLAALACVALLYAADQALPIEGIWPLIAAGLAYVLVYGSLQVLFVFRRDRLTDPLEYLATGPRPVSPMVKS